MIKYEMENAYPLKVPLLANIGIGESWQGSPMTITTKQYVNNGKEMSLWGHLSELRSRLIALLTTLGLFIVSIN